MPTRTLTTLFFCAVFAFLFLGVGDSQAFVELWRREGAGPHSFFGGGIQSLGDQNNDGYDDWMVSSSGTGIPGQIDEPRYDLFFGGDPPSQVPYMTFKGRLEPYRELRGFQVPGDLNDDGFVDWWVQYIDFQDTMYKVEFHFGGPEADTAADGRYQFRVDEGTNWMLPLGDWNGDGHADWFMYEGGGPPPFPIDRATIFLGSANIDTTADYVLQGTGGGTAIPSLMGDYNGDGYDDFIAGNWNLYLGSQVPDLIADAVLSGPISTTEPVDVNADGASDIFRPRLAGFDVYMGGPGLSNVPTFTLSFAGCDANAGPQWINNAGDFNDDGYNDIVACNPDCMTFGVAKVYLGGAWLNPDPIFTIDILNLDVEQIWTALGVGDINNDGVDDLAIGATGAFWSGQRGEVVIVSGDTSYHVGIGRTEPSLLRELQVSVYPNPFNSSTTLSFDLPSPTSLTVTVFDITGREVMNIDLGLLPAGSHSHNIDATQLPSGIYFARISSPPRFSGGDQGGVIKLALIR
ncbi:T9SS type A sorting domain-containing protein [bacterium]|nr:T9SS type A sorting domain-containing protein [bacterium]